MCDIIKIIRAYKSDFHDAMAMCSAKLLYQSNFVSFNNSDICSK